MKKLFIVLLFPFQMMAQEVDVKKAIDVFFEGLHTRDTVKIKSVLSKEMVLHSVAERREGAKLSAETVQKFCRSVATIPLGMKVEEKLLSYKVQIDGSMAQVWTPYEFYINGKLSHSGVNSFQLFKDADGWKITYCIDTRRKP